MDTNPPLKPATGEPRKKFRRSIAILPSVFTTGNLFCGFFAIMSVMREQYELAPPAIGIAVILDALDGRIARMAKSTSDFGLQLDSLADVVSFGLAPAVLLAGWGLAPVNELAWFVAFVYLTSGAMRLARFNIQAGGLKHFVGLPIPAAAGCIAAIVHAFPTPIRDPRIAGLLTVLGLMLAFLMVSKLKYPSFKSQNLQRRRSHLNVLLLATLIAAVWAYSRPVLLGVALAYFSSGIVLRLYSLARPRPAEEPRTIE
ncbi:MAG: CDP-diacylglycerol--serine O-phosphatidyltransferase [Acidobacteriota bacterium]